MNSVHIDTFSAMSGISQFCEDNYPWRFVNPLIFRDYTDIMKKNVGSRLPKFTRQKSMQGKTVVNHYMKLPVKDGSSSLENNIRDFNVDVTFQFCTIVMFKFIFNFVEFIASAHLEVLLH
ncbi:hypothetical protein RND71_039729 [Anisodus tanguticus]|uniref:Uncharacterized protein n=1 Tax=Anisodus tanguticus TaxID=243964 RepID=A0AAE1UQX2_9SOLA|nr:hypothetical protein RND71_039729 [Anisodus tanguticus]